MRLSKALVCLLSVAAATSQVPKGFPAPVVPPDNPATSARVELGRYLFYDTRLSVNNTTSCATCHRQELAFTDGRAHATGATHQAHRRASMSLVNLAWNTRFNWGDPGVHSLEEQALKPMMSTAPLELGFASIEKDFLRKAQTDGVYGKLFPAAFPGSRMPWTTPNIAKAIACFERTIVSRDSPWDRFHLSGDATAISESAKRGEMLFFLDGGPSCFRCHGGFNFADITEYHNTGLYNIAGKFSYPRSDLGLYESSGRPEDVGKFRAPTLRNIAVTAPYMHDGSVKTLGDVLDNYAAGGHGAGNRNPNKDKLVRGFPMTPTNRKDLIAFLESLTDEHLLHDPRWSNPWPASPPPAPR